VKTTLFRIPNLQSRSAEPIKPWEVASVSFPTFKEKEEFRKWCAEDTTDYLFVSSFEGLNPHVRVSKSNEPFKMHGLIADYDAPLTDEQLLEGLARGSKPGFKPMYAHKTFSSGARVVWMFEEPVYVLPGVLKEFLHLLVKETKAKTLFPRMDEAIYKPDQYYAWFPGAVKFADQPIRTEAVHSVLSEAVEKSKEVPWRRGDSHSPGSGLCEGSGGLPGQVDRGLRGRVARTAFLDRRQYRPHRSPGHQDRDDLLLDPLHKGLHVLGGFVWGSLGPGIRRRPLRGTASDLLV